MPLYKLQFTPGINREITGYANEGGWWDCDKIRFRQGYPEKIGGWIPFLSTYYLGTARALHPWTARDTNQYIGVGTNLKYYVATSGGYNDITPIRETTAAGAVTFVAPYSTLAANVSLTDTTLTLVSAASFPAVGRIKIDGEEMSYNGKSGNTLTNVVRGVTPATHTSGTAVGCATIVVSDINHGVYQNDFVTFSGASALGGNMTAAVLNQEYQVTAVPTSSTYTIEARTVSTIQSISTASGLSPTYVYSTSADSGSGGAATVAAYQINSGLDTNIVGTGWGAGTWGRNAWGSAADVAVPAAKLRLWGHDNYGQDLIFNVRDGGIYYWAESTTYPRAEALHMIPGASYAPQIARQVLVSDADRHVIAFGCDDEFNPGVQDPLLIRFSSQENYLDWQSLPTNTAGSLRLGSGSGIVTAVETKQQIVVFTDTSVHAMQYLGPPYTFGLDMLSDNISIASPNAAISVDDAVFWMGEGEFYVYNGVVTQLPCTVKDYVFSNINGQQFGKITCGASINYNEVWWFYPSANSTENDRYVVYNYQQKLWYFGTIVRTAWTHRNTGIYPMAASTDNRLYLHEYGWDDGSTAPASALPAFIESSGQDIGDGDQFAFIWRVIPDVTFRNSTGTPRAIITIKAANFPGADFSQSDSRVVAKTASVPVEQYTNQVYTRIRGRSFTFRIDSTEAGTTWRLGAPRIDTRTDGRR